MVVEAEVVHGSDGSAGRVGSGRVGSGRVGLGKILSDFGGSDRVGTLGFLVFTDHFLVPRILNSD